MKSKSEKTKGYKGETTGKTTREKADAPQPNMAKVLSSDIYNSGQKLLGQGADPNGVIFRTFYGDS